MENCITTSKSLLKRLNVPFTNEYLENNILSHPDHPSLLCISDTLEKYNIETLAVKVDEKKLIELPMPCIVQLSDQGGFFHILQSFSNDGATYFDDKENSINTTKEEFLKKWTGICLLVAKTQETKEPGIKERLSNKRILTSLKVSILLMLMGWATITFVNSEVTSNISTSIFLIVYSLLKIIGLGTGILLLWFEIDQYNPTLQSFCSGGNGKKINCNAVLNSEYAKLFNGALSLSLVGFSYFFSSLLYLIVTGFRPTPLALLSFLSFTTLPAILISIYYQAIVIKQWCKFCIAIQVILFSEIVIGYVGEFHKSNIAYETLPLLIALFLLPVLGWKLIKPLLEKIKETNLYKRGLKKIKNNPDVLYGLLSKSRKIETDLKGLGICINNDSAKYSIVKVCNPYCGPCAKAHPILEELVTAGKINLQILFTASIDANDRATKPVSHFLAIDELYNFKTRKVLDDWYNAEKKDYDAFAEKYPMNGELKKQEHKIVAMHNWCDVEKITHTPTLFINGHELPKEYSIADLKEVLQ